MARPAWSKGDVKFLQSLGISADDPPDHERFVAVEGAMGWWYVMDREQDRKRIRSFGPGRKLNPEQTAKEVAGRLNGIDVTKK